MKETTADYARKMAIRFATWIEDNHYVTVYSKKLKQRAYVDTSRHDVLVHGSDYHFTKVIREHGCTLEELYPLFIKDEYERLKALLD